MAAANAAVKHEPSSVSDLRRDCLPERGLQTSRATKKAENESLL